MQFNKIYISLMHADELMSKTADFERLESLVDKTQQDKRKLGVRVSRLVQTGENASFVTFCNLWQ